MTTASNFWRGKRVFVTGNTGFKGGWLCTWLLNQGSEVEGYSLAPNTDPSFYIQTALSEHMPTVMGDIRDKDKLEAAVRQANPEIIFHLAAQPLVLSSYEDPATTFATNVQGTVNLLESVRANCSPRAVVVVTSDKCYENTGKTGGYREGDALGGFDPYSASKGCAEIVCSSYLRSFFQAAGIGLATVRAGNVIGGGDYSKNRITPDAIRALQGGCPIIIRNPRSVRPWQHVLDPLRGYIQLAESLFKEPAAWSEAWNFGPEVEGSASVSELAELLSEAWGGGSLHSAERQEGVGEEAAYLSLDSGKARERLRWRADIALAQSVKLTVEWYKLAARGAKPKELAELTRAQISRYQAGLTEPLPK